MLIGGGPGGGGNEFTYEPLGLKGWLKVDDAALGPYFEPIFRSSGVDWLKLFKGGLLVRRPFVRMPG